MSGWEGESFLSFLLTERVMSVTDDDDDDGVVVEEEEEEAQGKE